MNVKPNQKQNSEFMLKIGICYWDQKNKHNYI